MPFLLIGVVFVGSGGTNFLIQSRYQNRVPTTSSTPPTDTSSSESDLDLTSGRAGDPDKVFDDFPPIRWSRRRWATTTMPAAR